MGDLQIEYLSPGDLRPYPSNARTHTPRQVDQIAASIREFGFANPVLVGADGDVIAGHGRLLACEQLGLESVPVVRLGHLTESQVRALRVADNQIALTSGWDLDLLAEEVAALADEDLDLDLLGFDEEALAGLVDDTPAPLMFDDDMLNDRSKGRMRREVGREVVSVGRYIGAADVELIREAEAILQDMDPDEAAVLVCRLVIDRE